MKYLRRFSDKGVVERGTKYLIIYRSWHDGDEFNDEYSVHIV